MMKKIDINKYKKIPFRKRKNCQVCGTKSGYPVIDLPRFPMTEIYTSQKVREKVGLCDQGFQYCEKCGHAQLANVIDVKLQYGDSVTYNFRTSESATGSESANYFIDFIKSHGKRKLGKVLEIGCNDTYVLKKLENVSDKLVGIDPVLKGTDKKYTVGKITAIGDFFENVDLKDKFDTILCKDTLEHIENPRDFVRKIIAAGSDDAVYFFYHPFLETLLQSFRFDQVFHQHLNYFSLKSIIYMLNDLGCTLLDWKVNYGHWGCITYAFKKGKNTGKFDKSAKKFTPKAISDRFRIFKNTMENTRAELTTLERDGETVYGFGAAHMLPVLSYHLGNDFSSFAGIIDENKNKTGLYWIDLPVRIIHLDSVRKINESSILVTAISSIGNTRNILAKLSKINPRRIIVPLHTF